MRGDLDTLKADLADNAEALLVELFGQPTTKGRREWRWGRKGSVAYRFDRKTFRNFEADTGGDLLVAIMLANNTGFAAAVSWAKAWLGEDASQRPTPRARPRPTYDADAEQERARGEAAAMWRAGRSINGTAAVRYLQGRSIDGWPDGAVRFIASRDVARIAWRWWRWPALMFPLTNGAGDVTAVQLVALTDQGAAVPHWEHDGKIKMVRGVAAGAALHLPGDASGPLVLAEGGETALSIWLATGHETWAAFGAIGRADLEGVASSRTIVVGRDDDGPKAPSRKALRDAVTRWRRDGRHVVEAQPWALTRGDKSDFNDVLKQHGPDAVRARIDAALQPQHTTQGKPRTDALLELSKAVGRTVADLMAWRADAGETAPFKVIRATLGLGKSEATLQAIVAEIAAGHRVIYSAPTHDLAAELATRAAAIATKRGHSITVRVWHGRERDNPAAPSEKMCRDRVAAKLAQQAGIDVVKTVCDAPCEHRASCAYLAQREASADLWLVPHALLFTELPAAMKGAALLVIDEDFALAGIMGTEGPPLLVPFDALRSSVTHGNGKAAESADLNATLGPIRRRLLEAVADHPASDDGEPLQAAMLTNANLTADQADDARKAEGRRRRDVPAIEAPTRAALLRTLRQIKSTNDAAKRSAMLWGHIADLLRNVEVAASGRVDVVELEDGTRAFRLYGLGSIGKGWREVPTLHLDATANMDLLRLRVPAAELAASVEASEPFVSVHQVVGRTFGKRALEHGKAADDALRFSLAQTSEAGGRWLVVASKDAAEQWTPRLPPAVGTAHWGGLRGLDQFNDVDGMVCVGRWGVRPNDVGRMAAILTGRAVPRLDGWYPTAAVTLTAADGSTRTVDADRHPDTTAEAVRAALVDSELLQAIGRGRGVQRTEATPLAVYVLGNVPLPVTLASLTDWQPVDPYRAMLADHGAVLSSAADAAMVLGKTRNAVKAARQGRLESCPYKNYLSGQDSDLPAGLAAVTYQRKGPGRAEQGMVYDPRRIPDPRAWLEAHLGPLAYLDRDDQAPIASNAETMAPAPADNSGETAGAAAETLTFHNSRGPPSRPADLPDIAEAPAFSDQYARAREGDALADYGGGVMSDAVRDQVRDRWRASGLPQDRIARLAGISRPQLANALQGRFGLSADAAARLRAALAALPPPAQGALL